LASQSRKMMLLTPIIKNLMKTSFNEKLRKTLGGRYPYFILLCCLLIAFFPYPSYPDFLLHVVFILSFVIESLICHYYQTGHDKPQRLIQRFINFYIIFLLLYYGIVLFARKITTGCL